MSLSRPPGGPSDWRLSPRAVGLLAAVVTVAIWTAFIVIARASADPARNGALGPFDIVFARVLGAGLVLLPVGWWMVRRDRDHDRTRAAAGADAAPASSLWGLSPLSWRITLQAGALGGLLYALLSYVGFAYAPAGHASVLLPGSLPLWTALLALLVLGTRITPARATGLALIVAGDLLVGGRSLLQAFDGGTVWIGDLLFMGSALSWAAYSVLVRRHALDPVRATVAITALAFVVYIPVYLLLMVLQVVPPRLLQAPVGEVLFQMAFQGLGSVVISGISFVRMVQHFGPVRSTMLTAVVPGLSALGAVWLLQEPLHANLVLGLALVTLGIVFGVRTVVPATTAAAVPAAPRA